MIPTTKLRESIFRHLDGITIAPVAINLRDKGVLDYLLKENKTTLTAVTEQFKANEGYMNVALRLLASQGFLDYHVDNKTNVVTVTTNSKTEYAFSLVPLYKDVVALLNTTDVFTSNTITAESIEKLQPFFQHYQKNCGIVFETDPIKKAIQEQILMHIEGYLAAPLIVSLGMSGMFHKYFMETSFRAEEFHKEPEAFTIMLNFFTYLGWFTEKKGNYQFTEGGLFFAKRASAYGVTVSYLPMFQHMESLLFGNPNEMRDLAPNQDEIHVNREMNVWGSGGAHATYFKVIDDIIIELFNKPIHEQPKGILDMGCGNGAFLEHIFNVIERQTLRGKISGRSSVVFGRCRLQSGCFKSNARQSD